MKHMEIALAQEGVTEVAGPGASKSVLAYFAANGRRDITSDEVPWCAAFYFWVLMRAGVDVSSIPPSERLLAYSATKIGTRLDGPRLYCGVVMPRRDEAGKVIGHHVGFVTGWTDTTIYIFGGNQANSVNEMERKRARDMIFMWPIPPATAAEVAATGSRTMAAAGSQQKDAAKIGGVQGLEAVLPQPDPSVAFPEPSSLVDQATALQGWVSGAESFALFALGKAGWIAAALSAYWLARMAWNAWRVRRARVEGHNTGSVFEPDKAGTRADELKGAVAPNESEAWASEARQQSEEISLV